ncbi:hypothetical protein [Nonomuraea soli]|uniref:Knr4/Smi1-like domain-containing protein n=1 Tax=Nonomuraea soli TaxID=1032476 RepID=A0A7W0CE17_9ACTN|nr:hypothetical protein [Nonomuraea soli]MBA2889440.1 hypothetical protein [Nonomuraea soli]
MANILRALLTAAVLAAIVVRLRRRGSRTKAEPVPSPAPKAGESRESPGSTGSRWVPVSVAAGALVITLAVVLTPSVSRGERADSVAGPHVTPAASAAPGFRATGWMFGSRTTGSQNTASPTGSQNTASPTGSLATASPTGPLATGSPIGAEADPAAGPTPSPSVTPPPLACPAPRRTVTVRAISPQVRQAVARQWRRIERWMAANAPRSLAELGGRGRVGTVAVAEARMGVDLPDDLRASLLRHDGGLILPPMQVGPAYGTRQILRSWREHCAGGGGVLVRADDGSWAVRPVIPVASFAWLDPVTGAVDYTLPQSSSSFPVRLGASWAHALRAVAVALEGDLPVNGFRPRVVDGRLRWETAN